MRVVLIDDDADLRMLTQATLQLTADWEVETASGGREGLALVRSFLPDVVVIDVMMPQMDGYEVCRQLAAEPETADIPVVFLTAYTGVNKSDVSALGAAGVIFKPFDVNSLASRIQELCAKGPNA